MNREPIRGPARSVANVEFHHSGQQVDEAGRRLVQRLEAMGVRAVSPAMGFPMEMYQFPGGIWIVSHKTVAVAAGLGHMGIHRNVIHPKFGNFILLGTVLIGAEATEYDAPLGALPVEPYVYAEWRLRRAGLDYHVDVEGHYYSVPYRFAREELEVRLTARTVEVFRKGERIAAHLRSSGNHKHTTRPDHMPSSHRRFADWTIERIRREASAIGASTATLCDLILENRPHPEQGFRACLGIVRLAKAFGRERVEAACLRALEIEARTYGSVKSILDNNLDARVLKRTPDSAAILHPNIRGPRYYH